MSRRTHSGSSPNRRLGARLRLEVLEDRLVLSASPTIDLSGLSVGGSSASDHVLIQYREGTAPFALSGTSLGDEVGLVNNLYKVNLSSGVSVAAALAEYRADGRVQLAEADYTLSVSSIPNDPRFSEQWGLNSTSRDVNAPAAWDRTTGSSRIVVALMDTGLDYNHPDLYQNVWINQGEIPSWIRRNLTDVDGDGIITFRDLNNSVNQGTSKARDVNGDHRITANDLLAPTSQGGWADGISNDGDRYVDDIVGWNFYDNNNRPTDLANHGTHVAGIIGAMGNNGVGVAGVDWKVQLMPVKFIGPNGGSVSSFITGLDYAVKHGAKISNNSWSGAASSQALTDAVNAARAAGHVFVAAAGNNGTDNDQLPTYPASLGLDNVISVAATERDGSLASFSNYGARSVDIGAPGVDILSTVPTAAGSYALNSGTSMATPFVTGVAALVWAKNPTWTYRQVITQVLGTAEKSTALQGKVATSGIVNAAAAVGAAAATSVSTPHVTSAVATGPSSSSMSSIRLTFDQAMDASSFTSVDCLLRSPSGATIAVSSVRQADSLGKVFTVFFSTQSAPGGYTLKVGPFVRSKTGVNMTTYSGNFILPRPTTTAPRVTSAVATGPSSSSMSSIRLTFDQAMDASSFTSVDCLLRSPSGATIAVSSVRQADSLGKVFTVAFPTQSAPGGYSLRVGPYVRSKTGVNMTTYSGNFILPRPTTTAPHVTSAVARGSSSSSMSAIRLTFDRAMNASTFTAADCLLKSPSGATIAISSVRQADSLGKVFDVTFATQWAKGGYGLRVGPYVQDRNGVNMTTYSGNFVLPRPTTTAPHVTSAVARGSSSSSMSAIRLTFDRAMNASTFTAADCLLKSPSGATIAISSVRQADSLGKVFDVTFATQWAKGGYGLRVGPYVQDRNGVNMTTYSGNFVLPRPTTASTASVASVDAQTAPATYVSTKSAAITPNGRAVVMLTVTDDFRIADLNVRVNLTHPKSGDLYVHLKAPDGTEVVLTKQTGGASPNLNSLAFDDEAAGAGSCKPVTPLSVLNGKTVKGTWMLWVEDRGGVNSGTVDGFALIVTPKAG